MRRFHLSLAICLITAAAVLAPARTTFGAATTTVEIKIFWAEDCPHCETARFFLGQLSRRRPEIVVREFEVSKDPENLREMLDIGRELSADASGVPFIVVGNRAFSGFLSAETTGREIESAADRLLSGMTHAGTSGSPTDARTDATERAGSVSARAAMLAGGLLIGAIGLILLRKPKRLKLR